MEGFKDHINLFNVYIDNFINDLKKRFTVNIDEVEAIKENVVFKIPKKLN